MTEPTEALVPAPSTALSPRMVDWQAKVDVHREYAKDVKVTTEAEAVEAASRAKEAATLFAEIDEARDNAVRPINGIVKQINDQCRPLLTTLTAVKDGYKAKLGAWQDQQERLHQERERIAREEAERIRKEAEVAMDDDDLQDAEVLLQQAEDTEAIARATAPAKSTPRAFGTFTGTLVWVYTVVDKSKLPLDALMVNESYLKAQAKIKPKPPEIPGCELKQVRQGRIG